MERLSCEYEAAVRRMDALLGVGRCCDLIARNLWIGGRRARAWVIDGYGKDEILERMYQRVSRVCSWLYISRCKLTCRSLLGNHH